MWRPDSEYAFARAGWNENVVLSLPVSLRPQPQPSRLTINEAAAGTASHPFRTPPYTAAGSVQVAAEAAAAHQRRTCPAPSLFPFLSACPI